MHNEIVELTAIGTQRRGQKYKWSHRGIGQIKAALAQQGY